MQHRIFIAFLVLLSISFRSQVFAQQSNDLEKAQRIINNNKLRKVDSLTTALEKRETEVEKKYKDHYLPIYNSDIKAFSLEFSNFKVISNVDDKLKTGKELILKLNEFDKSFTEFNKMDTMLSKTYPRVETIYKSTYRPLYRNEVSPLEKKIELYLKEDTIAQKLKSGKMLSIQLMNLQDMYPVFQKIDTSVAKKFPIVEKRYEEVFPLIHKWEIKPVKAEIEFYNELNIVSEKLRFGQELDEKLKNYDLQFNELIQQEKEIKEKHEAFEKAYLKNKPNKYIYKRGADLYDNSMDGYKAQTTVKTKKEKGDGILLVLNKLISISSADNTALIASLKKAKTEEDMKKVLGL